MAEGRWQDQSVSGNNAAQSTSGDQPQLVTSGLNGEPVVGFNGSTLLTVGNVVATGQDYSVFVVSTAGGGVGPFYTGNPSYTGWGFNRGANLSDYGMLYGQVAFIPLGPLVNQNSAQLLSATRTSGTTRLYAYGTLSGTSGAAMNNPAGITSIGGIYPGQNFTGNVAEILVYNCALSDSDRQNVEVCLADKYGLYHPDATWPSAYSSAVQAEITLHQWSKAQADGYVAFQSANPGMLTDGLALWLKADSGVTQDGSGNVNSWDDQTGNYTVTQTGGARPAYVASEINGQPALRFNGSQSLYNPTNIQQNADLTMIVVGETSSEAAEFGLWLGGTASSSNRGLGYVSSRQYFSTFGNDTSGGNGPNLNTFTVQAVTLDSTKTHVNFYLNGLANSSATLGGIQNVEAGISVGAIPGWGLNWNGDIAEVLVYDHQLSSAELQEVGVYLADKYGLYNANATWPLAYSSAVQAEITRNQWNKAQADNYVALQSAHPGMLTDGLALWLKADSGVTQDGSGNVNSWTDQTGNYPVSQTGSARPTYVASDINGQPALRFNGSQSLYNPTNIQQNADLTMIVVGATPDPANYQIELWLGAAGANLNRGLGYASLHQFFSGFGNDFQEGSEPNANTFAVQAVTLDSTKSNLAFYLNGVANGTAGISGLQNLQAGISIGTIPSWGLTWTGDIAEVLVYDHQLSSAELQEVGVYLADKYGLYNANATWPLAYSSAVQAEITRNQWSKAQADGYVAFQSAHPGMLTDGLALWLKADNGVTQDGSGNVNSWTDQTGNYPVSQTGSARPTYVASDINGQPALRFNGSQSLYNPTNIQQNADLTMIVVGATPDPANYQFELWLGAAGANLNRGLGYGGSHQYFSGFGNDVYEGNEPNANTFAAQIVTLDSTKTNLAFYLNGAANGTSSMSGLQNLQAGISIGTIPGWGLSWTGDIAEVLVYDHQLSSTELQEVGVYLANKYNLALTVPAPTLTPNGGTFSSSTTVSFSSVQSPAIIRYTLDGSAPTASSTPYTASFTLAQSCPVNAAIFLNNVEISPVATAQFYIGDSGSIGISDAWQMTYFGHTGIDPNAQSPGGSGLTNLQAYLYGYNPTLFSTNGDGLSDLVNHLMGYNATNTDINGYGLTNAQQLALGLDPFDTGVNPAPPTPPTPDSSDHTAPTINLNQPANATLLP